MRAFVALYLLMAAYVFWHAWKDTRDDMNNWGRMIFAIIVSLGWPVFAVDWLIRSALKKLQ